MQFVTVTTGLNEAIDVRKVTNDRRRQHAEAYGSLDHDLTERSTVQSENQRDLTLSVVKPKQLRRGSGKE